jgi:PKHD-type hydroxylase
MKTITNNPKDRSQITHPFIYYDNIFNDNELLELSKECQKESTEIAKVGDDKIEQDVRISSVKFHHRTLDNAWIFDKLNQAIERINNDFYNFDLNGYSSFQYTEYEGSKNGKYDFHMDTFFGKTSSKDETETRKLSITFLLNEPGIDFEGGDFQICQGSEKNITTVETKKNRMIAFPSFLIHRVTPVTKGIRKSIVIWVVGPKFK